MFFKNNKEINLSSPRVGRGVRTQRTVAKLLGKTGAAFVLLFLSLQPQAAIGQHIRALLPKSDSVLLHFRFNSDVVDKGYLSNGKSLEELKWLLADQGQRTIDSITIAGYSSPEGSEAANNLLAQKRTKALKGYLVWRYPHLDQRNIYTRGLGENWAGLKQAVLADSNLPHREAVLEVLGNPLLDSEGREAQLKQLYDGTPYRYIQQNILPILRNASTCIVWFTGAADQAVQAQPAAAAEALQGVESGRADQPEQPAAVKSDSLAQSAGVGLRQAAPTTAQPGGEAQMETAPVLESAAVSELTAAKSADRLEYPRFAVKNNLLYDAILQPNVELEYYFAQRWSVNAGYQIAWWNFPAQDNFYQFQALNAEARYWFNKNGQFKGNYLGLAAGAGLYDLKKSTTGYQGNYYTVGLSWGYMLPIKKRLAIEFGLTVGYMNTQYDKYERYDPMDQHYVYEGTARTSYIGPTAAKLNLVWRFGSNKK